MLFKYFVLLFVHHVGDGLVCNNETATIKDNDKYNKAGVFTNSYYPTGWDDLTYHIPKVIGRFFAPAIRIRVDHTITNDDWTDAIWVNDQNDQTFQCTEFSTNSSNLVNGKAQIDVYIPSNVTNVKIFQHGVRHGVWHDTNPMQDVATDMCQRIDNLKQENNDLHQIAGDFSESHWPVGWEAKKTSHIPEVTLFKSFMVRVSVNHEMKNTHWISAIWIEDLNGMRLNCMELSALNASQTPLEHHLPKSFSGGVIGYEHCNQHGVWKSASISVANDFFCGNPEGMIAENRDLYGTSDPFTSENHPFGWSGKVASHVPKVETIPNNKIRVLVQHENIESHWITTIWVVFQPDSSTQPSHCVEYRQGSSFMIDDQTGYAYAEFEVPLGTYTITVYEHCNQHGVWSSSICLNHTDMASKLGNINDQPYSEYFHPQYDDVVNSHVPFFFENKPLFLAPVVRVLVQHKSMSRNHQITSIWITDQENNTVDCKSFDALGGCTATNGNCLELKFQSLSQLQLIPYVDFYVPFSAKSVTAYISCNLHGVWKGQPMAIDLDFCTNKLTNALIAENELLHGVSPDAFNAIRMPPNWVGKNISHIPIVTTFLAPMVRVEVPHEMVDTHWITTIWLKDSNGDVIACQNLENLQKPQIDFYIPNGVTVVTAFEHCNKHGVWESETVSVNVINYCDDTNALIAENTFLYNAAGPFFLNHYPNNWANKAASHVPVVTNRGNVYRVTVPHEMTDEHWITAIWVVDQNNETIICKHFGLSDSWRLNNDDHPFVEFNLPKGTSSIYAYEHCNKHGVWQSCFNEAYLIAQNAKFGEAYTLPFTRANKPDGFGELAAAHIPDSTMRFAPMIEIEVDHEMIPNHHIFGLWILDQNQNKIVCEVLNRSQFSEFGPVEKKFYLPIGTTSVTVYTSCNLHGVWMSHETVPIVPLDLMKSPLLSLIPENKDLHGTENVFTFSSYPSGWETKTNSHVPKLEMKEKFGEKWVSVMVQHEMTAMHWITAIWVEDKSGKVLHFMKFDRVQDGYPMIEFKLDQSISFDSLTAYEHCNKHGLWMNGTSSASPTNDYSGVRSLRISSGVVFGIILLLLL